MTNNTKLASSALIVLVLIHVPALAERALIPGEREAKVAGIPNVIGEGAEWELIWADFVTADGIVGTADGGVLFAQEQTHSVVKLDADGREYVYMSQLHGPGSLSMDAQGRLYAVERTCTEPLNPQLARCRELTRVSQIAPERRVLANSFVDGRPLGRINDLIADGNGGAYFTVGGLYHVNAEGVVSAIAEEDIRTNGLMLSRDGETLYVTNVTEVLAFDVLPDGTATGRRLFATLEGDDGADGMAIDSEGRVYVTGNAGVHVLTPAGEYLGLIPTPRRPITVAFSGPEKRILYVPQMGAVGPDGRPWSTPEGIRNTAMTIYTIEMLAQGYMGRPK